MAKVIKRKSTKNVVAEKKEPKISLAEAERYQFELYQVLERKKQAEAREKELKAILAEYMDVALDADGKGHRLLKVVGEDGQTRYLQRQNKSSRKINPDRAIPLLLKKGLKDLIVEKEVIAKEVTTDQIIEALEKSGYDAYIDVLEEVDEKALTQKVVEGVISMSELKEITDVKEAYAMTFLKDLPKEENEQEDGKDATNGNGKGVPRKGKRA